jgi:hypothetical protein
VSIEGCKGYRLVRCDMCGGESFYKSPGWRLMRHTADGQPVHLCDECRAGAIWCAEHQRYHRAGEMHRRPCAGCGGLFTARADLGLEHCPACARAHAPAGPRYEAPPARRAGAAIAHLFHELAHHWR